MNGIFLASRYDCTGCSACASACPKGCIQMLEDREGFLQPKINTKSCIKCHKCERVCPVLNPEDRSEGETKAYAVINKDEEIRANSSSGGVFYALAKWTIDQGGVVFGARFNEQWEVVHDYSETIEGIYPFMGSKYVQSRIGECYKQAKAFLDDGRWVLFSGTPCQLAGLRGYLRKDYEKLLQVDLICHGVPSPKVWREYIHRLGTPRDITRISFRDKSKGWLNFRFVIEKENKRQIYSWEHQSNPFFKGFLGNLFLRNSCYNCTYRQYCRRTDLTIADYWGVNHFCSNMFDDKGTSLVLSHSERGVLLINAIKDSIQYLHQEKSSATKSNLCDGQILSSANRSCFFTIYRFCSLKRSLALIEKKTITYRVLNRIIKLFRLNV